MTTTESSTSTTEPTTAERRSPARGLAAGPASGTVRLGGPYPDHSSIEVTDPSTGATVTRYYTYVEPDPATPDPVPLVIGLHGGGGNMRKMYNALGFDAAPGPRPYLTVIPQGFGPSHDPASPDPAGIWNSGQSWSAYQSWTGPLQDDVNFIDALLLEVTRRTAIAGWRVDQSRTSVIGFSNGGMMAYRLAAERSSEFAAAVIMQAGIGGDPDPGDPTLPVHVNHPGDHRAEPVAILQLHGLLDPGLSLTDGFIRSGRNPRSDLPVMDGVDVWVAHNNCGSRPTIDSHPLGLMRTWSGGDGGTEVKLLTMPSVAHQVPAGVMRTIEPFLATHHK
ncbi:MAG: hypothetical protein AAF547_02450 [Actinomycetota bacterium]